MNASKVKFELNSSSMVKIQEPPAQYPFKFVMIADTYTAVTPEADVKFAQLLSQIKQMEPKPLFMVHLGDFAYPGTVERYQIYKKLIDELGLPTVTVLGNHEMDDPNGFENYHKYIGKENFSFDYGNTRFIGLYTAYDETKELGRFAGGPRDKDLEYLEEQLKSSTHINKIVFTHVPPYLDGYYSKYLSGAGSFKKNEKEFRALLEKYKVKLVGCAHILAFDKHTLNGVNYIVTGGGGADLQEKRKNVFHHFVLVTVDGTGQMEGNVIKINEGTTPDIDFNFTIS